MSTTIIEIAKDLSVHHPNASPQQIADIIIDAIESSAVISKAIYFTVIPTTVELKQAELKSKRLPRKGVTREKIKERDSLLEHIENVRVVKQLKFAYTQPLETTSLRPIIGLDGARVTLFPNLYSTDLNNPNLSTSKHRHTNSTLLKTMQTETDKGTSNVTISASHQETLMRNTRDTVLLSQESLPDVLSDRNGFLSLFEVYKIISLLYIYSTDERILTKVDETIRKDITLRNRDSKLNCLEELYRGEDNLPEDIQLKRPALSDLRAMTLNRIRAIILDEYRRLLNQVGQRFMASNISYNEYIQNEKRIAEYANELLEAVLHIESDCSELTTVFLNK